MPDGGSVEFWLQLPVPVNASSSIWNIILGKANHDLIERGPIRPSETGQIHFGVLFGKFDVGGIKMV